MLKTRRAPGKDGGELASAELALDMVEWLATADRPKGVTEAAQALETSKSRAHRHLRVLVRKGFARQDESGRYDIAVKLVALGERVRERFDILAALRGPMARLRDETGLAVTASTLVEGEVVILELLQGRMLIDFGVKPGTKLDLHASAHGLVALAFGPEHLAARIGEKPLRAWTSGTLTDPAQVRRTVSEVRDQGWASAPDQVMLGVNALAAPVFDHRGAWRGTVALVGSSQFIATPPSPEHTEAVRRAAAEGTARLGGGLR